MSETTETKNASDPQKSATLAVLATCVAYGYFNIGDAALKILAGKYHFSQVITLNCLFIVSFLCLYAAWSEGKKAFRIINYKLVFWRAVLSFGCALCNVFAFPNVKLTTFYTLIFTSPFWVAILSAIFLKEKLERKQLAIILGGFSVILYIFRPGGGLFNAYAGFVLLSAFFYSASMIILRKMGPKESRTMIIVAGSVISTLACLPFLPGHFVMPTLYEWGLFAMMGLLGAIGISCIAYAFQNAPSAATIAPYHYTQIVWGVLLGYYIFGEVPAVQTLIGAAVIIAGGLYIVYGEARGARKKAIEAIAKADLKGVPPSIS